MAFSNLTSLTKDQYDRLTLTPLGAPPRTSSENDPDPDVHINLGGWVNTTVLAFTISSDAGDQISNVGIDSNDTRTISMDTAPQPGIAAAVTYWTVDVGSDDGSNQSWEVKYKTRQRNGKTGKYVFAKGTAK